MGGGPGTLDYQLRLKEWDLCVCLCENESSLSVCFRMEVIVCVRMRVVRVSSENESSLCV